MGHFISDILPTDEPILFRLKTDLTKYRTDEELSIDDFCFKCHWSIYEPFIHKRIH